MRNDPASAERHRRAIESTEQAFNQEFNYVEENLTQSDEFILGPRTPEDVSAYFSADQLNVCPALRQHFDEDR
jgi:hypothetical protein